MAVTLLGEGTSPDETGLSGQVVDDSGGPVEQLTADLFTANDTGERLTYLRSTATGPDGRFGFSLDAGGCYAVTYIAPPGSRFTNGSQWLNQFRCLSEGQQVTDLIAALAPPDGPSSISGFVFDGADDTPAADVVVDLFQSTPDGSRGTWLGDTGTDTNGRFLFETEPGCYVVTLIAPDDRTWVVTGSLWYNQVTCVDPGDRTRVRDSILALP